MGYSDNPRKIYGRVEIIYSDEELSREFQTTESGNSEISHPKETYLLPSVPTVKACTMDGNATMDGTFQMMDDTCVVGWWGGSLADSNGNFTTPQYIELSFVQRPVITWRIIGDSKLNQFPVDFTVEYKRNGKVVFSDMVQGNALLEVVLQPVLEDITSVRLTITKWNVSNACVKILRSFDRLYEMYEGEMLQSFEVNEEMCAADGNYNINSDTMTVSIHNTDRKFDRGYLRSLLLLDRKIRPFIGVEKDGGVEYTSLGTFYSDEWQVSQDSQWVKCTAVDQLLRLQDKVYVGFPLINNASLYDIAEDILQKAGFTEEQYSISAKLKDIVVDTAYLPKMATWDALQEVANAGLCKVFVDREDRIQIVAEGDAAESSPVSIHSGNTFSFVSSITLTEFANRISVDYSEISISDSVVDTAEVELNLDPNERVELTMDYASEVAYALAVSSNPLVRIEKFEGGVNACTCVIVNTSDTYQSTVITVSGNAIEVSSKTVVVSDEASIINFGVTEFSHPTSELVQSREHAEYIANILLHKMHAGEGVITTVWRGDPALGLGDDFSCTDRFGDSRTLQCEYNKFTYDGGLKQETRGRKV